MGIFGWSYPPGAENDPYAPYNQDADEESDEGQVVEVDFDSAYSVAAIADDGSGADCVYFDVAELGGKWFMSAVIDCDSASFVDSLCVDDGPYETEAAAKTAGLDCATDWMLNNGIFDFEVDSRIKEVE